MRKIILLSVVLVVSSLNAADYNLAKKWELDGCTSCHGQKGNVDPSSFGVGALNSFSSKTLANKFTKLNFQIRYNYDIPAAKLAAHKPLVKWNNMEKREIANLIGEKTGPRNSTTAKKTVETVGRRSGTVWGYGSL